MQFLVKKTSELSSIEIDQILSLFKRVFEKERTKEIFLNQSIWNPLGFSYHSLMLNDQGEIVGLNTYVPSYFLINGEKTLFANSTDSMVEKTYRDFFNFKDMIDHAYKTMKHEGVNFVYGYPNDTSFPVLTKSKLMKEIGRMNTYFLPWHIGSIKKNLSFLNPVSELGSRFFVCVSGLFASSKENPYLIEKDTDSYNATRYKRGDGKYLSAQVGDAMFFYKITKHEGVKTAFIIDITKKSPKSFNRAVKYLMRNHRKEFDLILYPGYLNFKNTSLIRLPRRFEPKNFNFTGKALSKELPPEIWHISNWDTNLSNYDLI